MKRQVQELGVRKWYGDAIISIQNEIFKALEDGILNSTSNIILGGCSVTPNGGNSNISEGIVYLDGKICVVPESINVSLPIWITKSLSTTKTADYVDNQNKATEETYGVTIHATSQGGEEIKIAASDNPRLLLAHIDDSGRLTGLPISDSILFNSGDSLATSKAVRDLNIAKQDKTNAVKFFTHPFNSSPNIASFNQGDQVYVGNPISSIYRHIGTGSWIITNL